MKTYTLEFNHFCTVSWEHKEVTITALSMIQLIRAFINEMRWSKDNKKAVWNKNSRWIAHETLTFPIITSKSV